MSVLSGKATLGEKLRFCFDMFDVNRDGKIRPSEMFTLFRAPTSRPHPRRPRLRRRATRVVLTAAAHHNGPQAC